jgi:adenylosuccinate lyase
VRHDVMAHVYAYGEQCPAAKPIIHLGATSCYVGDNADLIAIYDALGIIEIKLAGVIDKLSSFALRYKDMPCLGFTHFQPAQLTTVGKRATLWIQDLLMDLSEIKDIKKNFKLRGAKGTTGTGASFLSLFDGDAEKVKKLDKMVCEKLGFKDSFAVTGQTYPRKFDTIVLNALALIAQSAYKFSNDLRLLQSLKEIEEPFEKSQIGSSAMAYKRNPMRSERISALSRFLLSMPINAAVTASTQWFERTLDDSANRRLVLPQSFLAADAILNLYLNVASGLVVYENVISSRIKEELPFMATETILMEAVKRGGDRQELHESIRRYSMQAAERVKMRGERNDLLDNIKSDSAFMMSPSEIDAIMDPVKFTGCASVQTEDFIHDHVTPVLRQYEGRLDIKDDVRV